MAKKKRTTNQQRVAKMLAIILDEPQDNPDDPGEVRMEQARLLLLDWNDAQGSLMAVLARVIALKIGYCARCPEYPCPVCGADENTRLNIYKRIDGGHGSAAHH